VSSATGQVYLVVDPASGSRKPAKKPESNGARREWMIIMKFEIEVEKLAEGSSKVRSSGA